MIRPTALRFGFLRELPGGNGRTCRRHPKRTAPQAAVITHKPFIISIMGFVRQTYEPPSPQAVPHPKGHRHLITMLQNVTQIEENRPFPMGALLDTRPNYYPHGGHLRGHPNLFAYCSQFAARTSRNRLCPPPSARSLAAARQLADFKGQMGLFVQIWEQPQTHKAAQFRPKMPNRPLAGTQHPAPRTQHPAPPREARPTAPAQQEPAKTPPSVRSDRVPSPGTHTCPAEAR